MYVFGAFSRRQGDSRNVGDDDDDDSDVEENREAKSYVKWKQSLMKNECRKKSKKKRIKFTEKKICCRRAKRKNMACWEKITH